MLVVLALAGLALALAVGYAWGRRTPARSAAPAHERPAVIVANPASTPAEDDAETNAPSAHTEAPHHAAELAHLQELAEERRALFVDLAESRAETARWRDLAVAIENNAAPPLLGGPGAPDDLKLIVGVGPVLERMLHQLGVTSYRQIARWSERDIDAVDAKLAEFRGRIRRDGWVTQARTLHQSFHGEAP